MKTLCHAAGLAACALLAVQPAAAAEDRRDLGAPHSRGAAFAGASFSLPLGRNAAANRPAARLQFSPNYLAGHGARAGSGIELGLGARGKPSLQIGGRDSRAMEKKLALNGSGKYLVIGGVVILVVVVLAAVAGAQPTPGPQKGAFD
ncbi:MAG TPA: hypothetical protein VGC35_01455 [Allosphingosinicella sp.]|jgi:hypothetical protein